MSLRNYGTAVCVEDDDGTVTVQHADQIIGVDRSMWDEIELPHKQPDGILWLDTAGDYRYRQIDRVQQDHRGREVLIFERIGA